MTLNRDDLRNSAKSRRTDESSVVMTDHALWSCEYCKRDFVRETMFMNHKCPEHERIEELKTPRGQAAYSYYSIWMKALKRSVPNIETFSNSRQYNYFTKFHDWVIKAAVPNISTYIQLMVEADVKPVMWCRTTTYELYLAAYDKMVTPEIQFLESMDRLKHIAETNNVKPSEVYNFLGPIELAKLIRKRKLSPWFLCTSHRFIRWAMALPEFERELIIQASGIGAFTAKLKSNQRLTAEFRAASEAEDL